jgi:hypothetical protein
MGREALEQWLARNGIDRKSVLFTIDDLVARLGYRGPPLIFLGFFLSVVAISVFWIVGFSLTAYLLLSLFLGTTNWPAEIFSDDLSSLLISLIVSGFFFGVGVTFSNKRTAKKIQLPPWEEFLNSPISSQRAKTDA